MDLEANSLHPSTTPDRQLRRKMWLTIAALTFIFTVTTADMIPGLPRFKREASDEVRRLAYQVVYEDQKYHNSNEVVNDLEKLKKKHYDRLISSIAPLPPKDVKCLMSDDQHCSKEMSQMKSILIQAVKENCKKCSGQEKISAGHVIASMMAYDPVAWKIFLTKYGGHRNVDRIPE